MFATRTTVLFLLVLALGATNAFSLPIALRLTDGVTEVTITDGGAGDMNLAPDVITFLGAIGDWDINISSGMGSNTLGAGNLDLFSGSVARGGTSSTLTVLFTQSDNVAPVPAYSLEMGGTFTNVASLVYNAYADDANNPFGLSQLIGTVGPFTTSPFAADAQLSPVPEPASLLLIGSGLAGGAAWETAPARTVPQVTGTTRGAIAEASGGRGRMNLQSRARRTCVASPSDERPFLRTSSRVHLRSLHDRTRPLWDARSSRSQAR